MESQDNVTNFQGNRYQPGGDSDTEIIRQGF